MAIKKSDLYSKFSDIQALTLVATVWVSSGCTGINLGPGNGVFNDQPPTNSRVVASGSFSPMN